MLRINRISGCVLILLSINLHSQNPQGSTIYEFKKTHNTLIIDGVLDDEVWQDVDRAGGFFQTYPSDDSPAMDSTQFMITYSDEFIYVGIICYDYLPGSPITNTLKRDFSWIRNDNISLYIDPYNDRSNGFTFQVTPDNVQREGLVILGGQVQDDWDNKWYSAVSHEENYWSVEMAIPFKSIRFNSIPEWNIQFIRNNQKRNERSAWIQVPLQLRASDMVYSGKLVWDQLPPEAGTNVTLIPYISAGAGRNYEDGESLKNDLDAGFDAKVGLSNSLNLDLTFNPNFSQVEVDQQVTNLQRFEILFPEKRQFFLENQDLFARNGFPVARPFFSRRIGIQGSGTSQRNVPILAGARLSGKVGNNWRLGLMDMVTNKDVTSENIAPAQNYSVAVLERQIFKRSRVSATFVSRNSLGKSFVDYDSTALADFDLLQDLNGNELSPEDTLITLSEYNYVYGVDYNLATVKNKWGGNFYYHRSIDKDSQSDNFSQGGFLRYRTSTFNWHAFYVLVGDGYNPSIGFVRRTGITIYGTELRYNFYTEGNIQSHGPSIEIDGVVDRNWDKLDNKIGANYSLRFLNSAELGVGMERETITLQEGFDPSGKDRLQLAPDIEYSFGKVGISYSSDNRKIFSFDVFTITGSYFNGRRLESGAALNYRLPPILQVGIKVEYNRINLPDPFSDSKLLLISPRIDLTWTNNLFFTSFLQYNTQDKNFSQNYRFQWRFKPVSDLFIVYTDNYITTPNFEVRNRALVIKLSYWLNI
ncbi:MAG: carbohydrate binding family 9 domain-containing protein [Cytophagales bacterium]|nr:carbohydrate binding family 9 domain-containing protein [Cytophagales bacterium]